MYFLLNSGRKSANLLVNSVITLTWEFFQGDKFLPYFFSLKVNKIHVGGKIILIFSRSILGGNAELLAVIDLSIASIELVKRNQLMMNFIKHTVGFVSAAVSRRIT